MYDIGQAAVNILTQPHRVSGRLLASVNRSAFSYPVQLESGEVAVSSTDPIRRKLSATIIANINDPECDVFRTEMRAEYGIWLYNGDVVWVPVGTFVVTDANEAGRGRVEIKGEDRWRRVLNARFLRPVTTSGKHIDAIATLMMGADPRITVQQLVTSTSTHRTMLWERDRDKAILELAKAVGLDVGFDPTGQGQIRQQPSIGDPIAWTIGRGDGAALIDSKQKRSQGNTYNAVVAEGEGSDGSPPVRAMASITDPNSPIVFGGGFAQRPRYYRSALMTTMAQCQQAADSLLKKVSGVPKMLDLDSFVHPGLETGDVILAEVAPGQWERHLVDGFTIPLGPGSFSLTTRTPYVEEEAA